MACERAFSVQRSAVSHLLAVRGLVALVVVALLGTSGGCARKLAIAQDETINTAMQAQREERDRTGEPLELNIVCVTPADLKKDVNAELKPGSEITSAVWFRKRPIDSDSAKNKGRFELPKSQVYVLSNNPDVWGTRKGAALRGSKADGPKVVTEGDIAFPFGALHDRDSVIYVFAKFVDQDGSVLPVKPARFAPPGAYTHELSIRIGVDKTRYNQPPDKGQFVKVTAERKMHGKETQ